MALGAIPLVPSLYAWHFWAIFFLLHQKFTICFQHLLRDVTLENHMTEIMRWSSFGGAWWASNVKGPLHTNRAQRLNRLYPGEGFWHQMDILNDDIMYQIQRGGKRFPLFTQYGPGVSWPNYRALAIGKPSAWTENTLLWITNGSFLFRWIIARPWKH